MLLDIVKRFRILRYALVGGVAFIADAGTLYALTFIMDINYLFSAVGGFMIGLTINYLLSIQFVFADVEQRTKWTFQVFCLIGVVGLLLNELILGIFTEHFGFHYMASKMVSVFLVFLWNYEARRLLCFQEAMKDAQRGLHSRRRAGRLDGRL